MPKPASEKCRRCSKLTVEQAKARHGSAGTNCWQGAACRKRRSYYRNRDLYNKARQQQYAVKTGKEIPVVSVDVPIVPAAILHLYRERMDAPLHAISAELWVGGEKVAIAKAVHCLGWSGSQVRRYCKEILRAFSGQLDREAVQRFETTVELHPERCPIRPCPLHGEDG